MAVVNGFGGMRDYPDGLHFAPVLPKEWDSYGFKVVYCGSLIDVNVSNAGVTYRLVDGPAVQFTSGGREIELTPEAPEGKLTVISDQ
jgi:alpha,alpha-trehalose phosphorylase